MVMIPVHTRDTAGTGRGMSWVAKSPTRTRTREHRTRHGFGYGFTAGVRGVHGLVAGFEINPNLNYLIKLM